MRSIFNYLIITLISMVLYSNCEGSPKIDSTEVEESSLEDKTGIFADDKALDKTTLDENNINEDKLHTVVIKELLPTDKYIYLLVAERGEPDFWIATIKQELEIGETYVYEGGFLKTEFESKKHNRIFDSLYLVSGLFPADHSGAKRMNVSPKGNSDPSSETREIARKGSIRIADLINNSKEYEGKIVQISGECVKINPNIMGRNWIHLKDGSKDEYDLVITSDLIVHQGDTVNMKGIVVLDKDFGAGYRYQLIIENGEIVREEDIK